MGIYRHVWAIFTCFLHYWTLFVLNQLFWCNQFDLSVFNIIQLLGQIMSNYQLRFILFWFILRFESPFCEPLDLIWPQIESQKALFAQAYKTVIFQTQRRCRLSVNFLDFQQIPTLSISLKYHNSKIKKTLRMNKLLMNALLR